MTTFGLVEMFTALEGRIAQEKGEFTLFALVMREDAPDRWDLVVSAPWTGADRPTAVNYFIDQVVSHLGESGLAHLSRVVVVDPYDPAVKTLNHDVPVEHGRVEVRDSNFLGLPIKHAYVIKSKRPPAPAAA